MLPETPLPWVSRNLWLPAYFREVARRVDQVAVMSYDLRPTTYLPFPQLYRAWQRSETVALSRAMDGLTAELFIGIPTSEESTWSHWPQAENLETGLLAVIEALNTRNLRPTESLE